MSKKPFSEYLWQRTGSADPLISELEALLAPLRYDAGGAPIGAKPPVPPPPPSSKK